MSRTGFTPEMKAALRAKPILLTGFAAFDLRYTRARFSTASGNISFMGCTWSGMGQMASMSEIEETTELRATGMEFSLSGIPTIMNNRNLAEYVEFHTKTGGEVEAFIALFDPVTRQMIPDPKQIFAGTLDAPLIRISGAEFSVTLPAEGPLAGMNLSPAQRLNDETQRGLYPGDRGFGFVTAIQKKPDDLQ